MAENKYTMEKRVNLGKSKKVLLKNKTEDKMKSKKLKQMMKKRIIVRNLSFKVSEEQLKEIFSKFGEVLEVNIPVNEAGRKRGFAFVQFKDSKSQLSAMRAMNFKEICGRPVALDYALDKTTYQSQQKNNTSTSKLSEESRLNESGSDVEDEDAKLEMQEDISDGIARENEENSKVTKFLKEFNADNESEEGRNSEASDESSDSDSDGIESHISDDNNETVQNKANKRKQSDDVSEGKTVFIRNVSYRNTEDDLHEVMQEYGETVYCVLCMDPITDHPKGTAFVKFQQKESADKLVEESVKQPGIILDGRRLTCAYAVSRKELLKKNCDSVEVKDKRNLRLLKCSLIMHGSKESEGVSQTDMAKRAQLEIIKKTKLKNVNFFVSDKRLAVHNLPKNITDKDLRILFKRAAGKEAIIKEARVMRDFKKTDSQGIPLSRGFGFISFTEHEHALKALAELNNNPKIFTPSKRPIVEFSVENKVALLSQERKREKLKLLHKKKLEEKLMKNKEAEEECGDLKNASSSSIHLKRKKRKGEISNVRNRKMNKQSNVNNPSSPGILGKKRKNKQKNDKMHKKKKGNTINTQEKKFVSVLTDKYKKKLLDKFS